MVILMLLMIQCSNTSAAGAVAVSDGSIFSDTTRTVFLVGPDCSGNESSLAECPKHFQICTAQGGVGVICQGMYNGTDTGNCMAGWHEIY